jgi:hypothetical protein
MLETSVHRGPSVATRVFVFAVAVLAAVAAVTMSGCSPGADYPSLFPAIHDMPPPRAETTMDADQVQQATEALITERNHLSADTQGAGQAKDATAPATNAANPPAKKVQSQSTAAGNKDSATSGAMQGSAASGTLTAGAETK